VEEPDNPHINSGQPITYTLGTCKNSLNTSIYHTNENK